MPTYTDFGVDNNCREERKYFYFYKKRSTRGKKAVKNGEKKEICHIQITEGANSFDMQMHT